MSDTQVDLNDSYVSPGWTSWSRYSETMLRTIERKILSYVKIAYRGFFVDIGPVVGPADKIWTLSLNTDSKNTPLVLLHGLGAGVALWCLNLDSLAATRPVYAVDLLGFGRSSRPKFSNDGLEAEQQMVKAVEEWRREMKLERFVLLGHSMGGFLAASYALSYPHRVNHLILADPWGFPEKPAESQKKELPLWVKAIAYALQPLNPLWAVRAAGPLGQWLIDFARPDLTRKFANVLKDDNLITQYLYQCNAQTPSGEGAFHSMMSGFGWAKYPMVKRIDKLHAEVPITLLYGSKSWIDNSAGEIIKQKRMDSFVSLQVIPKAGHHVYADKPDLFNKAVNEACHYADIYGTKIPSRFLPITSGIPEETKVTENKEVDTPSTPQPIISEANDELMTSRKVSSVTSLDNLNANSSEVLHSKHIDTTHQTPNSVFEAQSMTIPFVEAAREQEFDNNKPLRLNETAHPSSFAKSDSKLSNNNVNNFEPELKQTYEINSETDENQIKGESDKLKESNLPGYRFETENQINPDAQQCLEKQSRSEILSTSQLTPNESRKIPDIITNNPKQKVTNENSDINENASPNNLS